MYFIKGKSRRFETCAVKNISRSGALLYIAEGEPGTFASGDILHLELLKPGAFDTVNLKAKIIRVLSANKGCGLGIKMDTPLDEQTFLSLT